MDGLNVALVNFTYGGGSGSGRHVYLLEKGLRELGVDVRVFHSGNVPHLRLPKTGSLSFALFSSAKLRGFELVHLHSPKLFPALLGAERAVVTVHGGEAEFRRKYGKAAGLLELGLRAFRGRIGAITSVMKVEAEQKGWIWIPNMTDVEAIERIRPSGERYVLFVGRNDPIKNYRLFVEVVRMLGLRYRAFGVEEVVPWEVVISHMKSAVCLMITSVWEGMPSVMLEAWASGCPVIANDLPAFWPFRDALILTEPTVEGWVRAFSVLDEKREELIKKGRELVKEFDYHVVSKRYLKLYDQVIGSYGQS
jgi:glycosyltransferase involved in cell wall biosynthesis